MAANLHPTIITYETLMEHHEGGIPLCIETEKPYAFEKIGWFYCTDDYPDHDPHVISEIAYLSCVDGKAEVWKNKLPMHDEAIPTAGSVKVKLDGEDITDPDELGTDIEGRVTLEVASKELIKVLDYLLSLNTAHLLPPLLPRKSSDFPDTDLVAYMVSRENGDFAVNAFPGTGRQIKNIKIRSQAKCPELNVTLKV